MTNNQRIYFYFPAWNRAAREQDWRMEKKRLVGKQRATWGVNEVNGIYQSLWGFARRIADREARAPLPDDFRHAMHIAALGQDKSSKDLVTREINRIVAGFCLMADCDDLDALMIWLFPENDERKRRIWFIENRVIESYARKICHSKFGTDDWHSLTNDGVRELLMTLKNRPAGLKPEPPRRSAPAKPATSDAQPLKPINLAKYRAEREAMEAAADAAVEDAIQEDPAGVPSELQPF